MAQNTVPIFNITIEEDKIEDVHQILEVIKPHWNRNDYVFKKTLNSAAGGLLNTMIKCHTKTDEFDAIMIRIHNAKVNKWIDRDMEFKCLKLLKHKDCAPNMIAQFNNGLCYEFISGEVLSHTRLKEETIWRLIATDLAKFHSTELNDGSREKMKTVKETMEELWAAYPEKLKNPERNEVFQRVFPPKEELKAQVDLLAEVCDNLDSAIVLCHHDVRAENIIWNEENQRIHFIDFELMHYDYQAREIASHFLRQCGVNPPDYSLMPSKEFQMQWLWHYLKKYYEFTDKNTSDVTESDVQRLYVQCRKFHLVLLLRDCVASPIFEETIEPGGTIDVLLNSSLHFQEYNEQKDRILSIKMP